MTKLLDRAVLALLITVTTVSIAMVGVQAAAPFIGGAFAQAVAPNLAAPVITTTATAVVIPWGDWASTILTTLSSLPIGQIVAGWLSWVFVRTGVPASLAGVLKTALSDQLLQ